MIHVMWYRLAVTLAFLMRPLPEPMTYQLDKVIDWIHHRDDMTRAKKTIPILVPYNPSDY